LVDDQGQADAQPVPALLERRDAGIAAADLKGDDGGGKLGLRSAIRELMAREVTVAVFCVTAFFAAVYDETTSTSVSQSSSCWTL
jgi:hypothetical protein